MNKHDAINCYDITDAIGGVAKSIGSTDKAYSDILKVQACLFRAAADIVYQNDTQELRGELVSHLDEFYQSVAGVLHTMNLLEATQRTEFGCVMDYLNLMGASAEAAE
jgi:hypothetical protein